MFTQVKAKTKKKKMPLERLRSDAMNSEEEKIASR